MIFFGLVSSRLKNLPTCEVFELQGMRPDEIARYIEVVSRRSGGVLPAKVPAEIFKEPGFFDVRDEYLKFVWANRKAYGLGSEGGAEKK